MDELKVGFSQDNPAKVLTRASLIHTALTTEPGSLYFPVTDPTMADFLIVKNNLAASLSKETSSSTAALRHSCSDKVVEMMRLLAADLELTARGDLTKLAATGYELRAKASRSTGPLPAPLNLRVKSTGISGEALCKVGAVPYADSYEGQSTLNPTSGPWTSITATTNSQNILFTGLDRGKDYFFRIRAIGASGPSGWSDVTTMMVV